MYVIKNALVCTMADAGVVKADILVENGKVAACPPGPSARCWTHRADTSFPALWMPTVTLAALPT